MSYPSDPQAVDLMIGFPFTDKNAVYQYLRAGFKDAESVEGGDLVMPAGYMFTDTPPEAAPDEDPIETTFTKMDRCGVRAGLFSVSKVSIEARRRHPGRVYYSMEIDPNDIAGTVRRIRETHSEHGLSAVTTFPAGCVPQVPVSDRRYYPIYMTCIDLDLPIISNAGIPGPRVPADCQHVRHFDDVCYDFPELRIVMRHGAEPWGGPSCEADAEMARLVLHDLGFRAEILSQGHHRLCQHPWLRQGDVRGLLPGWSRSGTYLW